MSDQGADAPRPIGRPSEYNEDIAATICARLADGESLRSVCRDEAMPGLRTVFQWLAKHEDFAQQYARAKDECADLYAEDIIEISDDGRNDWMAARDPENGGYRANGEHIQRSRLRVEARKWIASKLKPKKYGDRITQEHTGPGGVPLEQPSVRITFPPNTPGEGTDGGESG